MTRQELHVTTGPSAAGCLKATRRFKPFDVVDQWDHLSCGPLTSVAPLEAWRERRAAYWEAVSPLPEYLRAGPAAAPRPDLVPLVDRPDVLLSVEVVNVWLGASLDNQLFLAWLLELARIVGLDPRRIRLIQFDRHPVTGEPVKDVGELTPELAVAHATPTSLSAATLDDLRDAWAALTAAEPAALLRYIEGHRSSPAIFHRAFTRILGRFPHRDSGLNWWELELLSRVPQGGITQGALLASAIRGRGAELDHVGDLYVFHRLQRLASLKHPEPLLSRDGPPESYQSTVALTARGRDVLDHKANFVEMNGIDDWVGGIHLHSASKQVWYSWEGSLVASADQPGR